MCEIKVWSKIVFYNYYLINYSKQNEENMDCLLRVFFSHSINDSKNYISSENKALKVTKFQQQQKTMLKYMFYQKALTLML